MTGRIDLLLMLIYDSWKKQQKVFEFNNKAYEALMKLANSKRVEIYNCSNMSKVNVFERLSIDYAFKVIKESKNDRVE
jgi:peroxiredoxin family protein